MMVMEQGKPMFEAKIETLFGADIIGATVSLWTGRLPSSLTARTIGCSKG